MNNQFQLGLKRLLDIIVATAGLVVLAPLFLAIALAVALDSPGGVLFTQQRTGRGGKLFQMLKFRTMLQGAEEVGSGFYVGSDDPRITAVGRFLRRFSLDEIPQLVHVLSGQMSLVGPRPCLPYQLQYYSSRNLRRFLMRPGITGWSQVNGRNSISWPQRLERDVWYVENFTLALDLQILLRTPVVWFSAEGIYGSREKFFFSGKDDLPLPPRGNE